MSGTSNIVLNAKGITTNTSFVRLRRKTKAIILTQNEVLTRIQLLMVI